MKKKLRKAAICSAILFSSLQLQAQSSDSTAEFKPRGTLWGLGFGDYIYKPNADTVGNGLGRGTNQYSKIPASSRFFQFRRVYLGYNYDLSSRFSAEILLACEDDLTQGSVGNQTTNGDVLQDGKFAPYLKLANVRWKNIFQGSDLVLGEISTPAFPQLSEVEWGYRSIERTVADIRRTPSFDRGIALQGHIGKDANYGYNLMVGTGTSAKPENDMFQMFYGDVWAKFFNKRLIVDVYQDYEKIDWNPIDTFTHAFHHDRNTTKVMIAYTVPKFTAGIEAMRTTLLGDVEASTLNRHTYYYTTVATAISVYVRGRIYKDKLGFFARYDNYDPGHKISDITNNAKVVAYQPLTSTYDPTTREQFATFGVDYTPFSNVHLMPNFYLNTYDCTLPTKYYDLSPKASGVKGTDAVIRLTIYFIFGKKDAVRF